MPAIVIPALNVVHSATLRGVDLPIITRFLVTQDCFETNEAAGPAARRATRRPLAMSRMAPYESMLLPNPSCCTR